MDVMPMIFDELYLAEIICIVFVYVIAWWIEVFS
jgi:hypothetical protein